MKHYFQKLLSDGQSLTQQRKTINSWLRQPKHKDQCKLIKQRFSPYIKQTSLRDRNKQKSAVFRIFSKQKGLRWCLQKRNRHSTLRPGAGCTMYPLAVLVAVMSAATSVASAANSFIKPYPDENGRFYYQQPLFCNIS